MKALTPVLALEFRGVGNAADFSFLTRDDAAGPDVTRVDPLVDHIPYPLTLAEQAQQLVGKLRYPPGLVLAYCGTAALAAHVADIADARLILVDPHPVTIADVYRDFSALCRSLECDPPLYRQDPDVDDVPRWETLLQDAHGHLAIQYGGDEEASEMVDDLLGRYRGWLRFLRACVIAKPAAPRGQVTVLAGKPLCPLSSLLAEPEAALVHRVEAEADTLDSAEVQAMLVAAISDSAP